MNKKFLFCASLLFMALAACQTVEKPETPKDQFAADTKKFLSETPSNKSEIFRVFISSDSYVISQKLSTEYIKRTDDETGDKYFMEEISMLNKIDEAREGALTVWLYPDSGRIMQVRYLQSTYLREVDKILIEDVQRWTFKFPKKVIEPIKFDIRYRVVLRKKMTDDQIMDELRQAQKDKTGQ
ncbi:MAG: hypothetical protein JW982_11655 [Spirochaetes bacterium]|nr:hypothetical protein [Spirochaetota bacterium]